jgi:hypothetical protein
LANLQYRTSRDGRFHSAQCVDFTIAASGGDMSGATLSAELASNNVVIQSANGASGTHGNVNVDGGVSWTSGNKLTLSAAGNINVAAVIDASAGSGGVVDLDYGQAAVNAGNLANYSFGLGQNGFAGKINLQPGNNFITKLGNDGTPTTWTVITQLGSPTGKVSNSGHGKRTVVKRVATRIELAAVV